MILRKLHLVNWQSSIVRQIQSRESNINWSDRNANKFMLEFSGNLYVERSGKWQRYWCKIESTKMEFFTSQSSKSAEFSLALLDSSIATAPVTAADERSRCIVKVTLNESETVLLARDQRECKKWMTHLKVRVGCFLNGLSSEQCLTLE